MSVFRGTTSDPAVHRPTVDAPHPAGAPAQRHPLPSGHWAPPRSPTPGAYQEGPTEPLAATKEPAVETDATSVAAIEPRRPRRRPGVILAVLFSVLALLVSVGSGLLSWRTLETVRGFGAVPAGAVADGPVAAPEDARPPRPAQPAEYPVGYAKEPLRLELACAAVVHLDLDEPRADVAEDLADLRYESRCGVEPPKLSLGAGAATGSRQVSADTDAAGCDRAIRTGPLARGLQVEVRKGMALCVLTAAQPAELVLVEVIDVGGSGTAGLRATSWQVP